jgi:hypothetical protein
MRRVIRPGSLTVAVDGRAANAVLLGQISRGQPAGGVAADGGLSALLCTRWPRRMLACEPGLVGCDKTGKMAE